MTCTIRYKRTYMVCCNKHRLSGWLVARWWRRHRHGRAHMQVVLEWSSLCMHHTSTSMTDHTQRLLLMHFQG